MNYAQNFKEYILITNHEKYWKNHGEGNEKSKGHCLIQIIAFIWITNIKIENCNFYIQGTSGNIKI